MLRLCSGDGVNRGRGKKIHKLNGYLMECKTGAVKDRCRILSLSMCFYISQDSVPSGFLFAMETKTWNIFEMP